MSALCPTCGGDWPLHSRPALNISQGFIFHKGHMASVTAMQCRILHPLVQCMGIMVPIERLELAGWPEEGAAPSDDVLRVHIYRIREALEPLGLGLKNINGDGYVLVDRAVS